MRIVAGRFRGRILKTPPSNTTRPTTDRVREALMSSITSLVGSFEGLNVLDAFAGSGALGLEALSRGAQRAWFCERDKKVLGVLRANVSSLGLRDEAQIRAVDVLKHPPTSPFGPFDIVFLDPPYAMDPTEVAAMLQKMKDSGVLSDSTVVHYEHDKKSTSAVHQALQPLQLESVVHKTYGDIAFDLFKGAHL